MYQEQERRRGQPTMTNYTICVMLPPKDAKFILAGLRMYSDTLAEAVCDSNLTAEEELGFVADSKYVAGLIEDISQFVKDSSPAEVEAEQK